MNPSDALSAAEILIFLEPNRNRAREAFKLALKELMALRVLRIRKEENKVGAFRGLKRVLVLEPASHAPLKPHLEATLRLVQRQARRGEIPLEEFLREVQKQLGSDYGRFQSEWITPKLVELGLLEAHTARVLGLFALKRYHYTPDGARLKSRLEQAMYRAKHTARLLRDDPQQLALLMLSLGSAVLLVPEIWPHFAEINERVREYSQGGSGDGGVTWTYSDDKDSDFGGLEAAFSDFDSGFDSSDGGGDGGGGE